MTLQLNNPLRFRQNYLERIYNNHENCNTTLIEKFAKISALSSGRIDKYEYLPHEWILASDPNKLIEQAKFIYSHLGKAFEKHAKTIKDQEKNKLKQ